VRTHLEKEVEEMRKESVLGALLWQQPDPTVLLVFEALLKEEAFNRQEILEACHRSTNITAVSNTTVAVVAADPDNAQGWLHSLTRPFESPNWRAAHITDEFYWGAALGVFRAMNWIDEHWRSMTAYEQLLCHVIVDMAFSPVPTGEKPSSAYETQFSQSIKSLVKDCQYYKGERWAEIHSILADIQHRLETEKINEDQLPPLGKLLIDQLAYAVFGSISTLGRNRAVLGLLNDLTTFNASR